MIGFWWDPLLIGFLLHLQVTEDLTLSGLFYEGTNATYESSHPHDLTPSQRLPL